MKVKPATESPAEYPLGGFGLDLIGRDLTNNCGLIVENQLTVSDPFGRRRADGLHLCPKSADDARDVSEYSDDRCLNQ